MSIDPSGERNPYAGPDAPVAVAPVEANDASRWRRLGASLLDLVPFLAILGPTMYAAGALEDDTAGFADEVFWQLVGLGIYLALNGVLLLRRGQTIGKLLLGIRVVDASGAGPPGFTRVALLRFALPYMLTVVPFFGPVFSLLDVLNIFGERRRCIHDYMAGTRVVDVE